MTASTFRTILVHVDAGRGCVRRTDVAARLALQHDAHLAEIAPIGLLPPAFEDDVHWTQYRHAASVRRDRGRHALDQALVRARNLGVTSCSGELREDDAAARMSTASACADLVVLSPFDEADPTTTVAFVEQVVLDSARPVLVIPPDHPGTSIGHSVLVAWDASTAASRAVYAAMPILERATRVRILVVNARSSIDGHGTDPGADIAIYLARHGIRIDVLQVRSERTISETILAHADEECFDLVVAGAYGHSRLRETFLGGVTRALLQTTTVPVLLAR